jgi:hypothetical protein
MIYESQNEKSYEGSPISGTITETFLKKKLGKSPKNK